jgi:DNA polymerase-3 subunit epsilon
MTAAFHRAGKTDVMPALNPRCTQALSSPLLNLPPSERMRAAGFSKPKPPKLSESYQFFFNEELVGAHDALVDARACARVYLELVKREIASAD